MEKEIRRYNFEMREAGTDGKEIVLIGHAAVFNSWSEDLGGFRERVKPGAYKDAIKISDVRALYNHNSDILPLGRTPKTLTLKEDKEGLYSEIYLPDTQFARDLMVSIDRGDVTQMSYAFNIREEDEEIFYPKEGIAERTIHRVNELFDVSPVVYPAYKATSVSTRFLERLKNPATGDVKSVTAYNLRQANILHRLFKLRKGC